VDTDGSWMYFDEATQGNPQICGSIGVLFINQSRCPKFRVGLGQGKNNYVELLALKLFLMLVCERRVTRLQVFGGSLNVIKWLRGNMFV
jgi:ribonuclease HI